VLWAGYHEEDLAEHYRASDLLLFTARGSDEGHRAVLEAMGCGVPPATFPIDGVAALLGKFSGDLVAREARPEQLAAVAARTLQQHNPETLRRRVAARAQEFGYTRAAERLLDAYQSLLA
jgi:glycosyltransferase involved in cell wall biosynthesis